MRRARAVVLVVVLALTWPAVARAQDAETPAQPARGYAYPVAWLLPLVVLIGTAAVGRALTRDLRDKR